MGNKSDDRGGGKWQQQAPALCQKVKSRAEPEHWDDGVRWVPAPPR